MTKKFTKTVTLSDGETLHGLFEENQSGYFCLELNGIKWDYRWGSQVARKSLVKAAENLWKHACDEVDL